MAEALEGYKEIYVYLDFNEKLDQDFFKKPNLFFKIVNLHKKKPLVQLGSYLFQGSYEDCIGTKVFLKEIEDQQQRDVFRKKTPIHLDYFTKTVKCVNLKWLKIPEQITQIEPTEMVPLNLNQDYKTTLKKYKENSLCINDIIFGDNVPPIINREPVQSQLETTSTSTIVENVPEPVSKQVAKPKLLEPEKVDKNKQDILNLLETAAKIPTRRKVQVERSFAPDLDHLADPKKAKNILILKQLYLQNLTLRDVCSKVEPDRILEYVDMESSIQEGIIKDFDLNSRGLTEDEKNCLVSMKNFHNLCVPLQLTLLVEQLRLEKLRISQSTPEECERLDNFGRTSKDRYRILKTFAKDIWYHLFVRLGDNSDEVHS